MRVSWSWAEGGAGLEKVLRGAGGGGGRISRGGSVVTPLVIMKLDRFPLYSYVNLHPSF